LEKGTNMLYYPTKLNEIAARINDATVAWITAGQDHDPQEQELSKEVDRIRYEQDKEELRLRRQGMTMLYDYEHHVYYAIDDEIKSAEKL